MRNYDFLVKEFGEEKIKKRYEYLYSKMEEFVKTLEYKDVQINVSILNQVLLDYFTDIYRTKEFHDIKKVNKRKIVAYQTYWILRRKPLQIMRTTSSKDIFINERFVMSYLTQEFLVPAINVPLADKNVELKLKDFLKHLFYHLKYRYIDQQYLELILYSYDIGRFFEPNTLSFESENMNDI
ncbi:hypothetical protein EZS27_007405 [termite gut metagenome]|uniref:Uncharacterized protein n=1 Tax=termite gut metagenome TaxID=433724 RepID=A0A5J4SIA0_9ZZZZ